MLGWDVWWTVAESATCVEKEKNSCVFKVIVQEAGDEGALFLDEGGKEKVSLDVIFPSMQNIFKLTMALGRNMEE